MRTFYLSFFSFFLIVSGLIAQTPGELTVSVSTSETGGNYAPRNIVAIWIEDNSGIFQKTLLAYAQTRKTHLNTWQSATAEAGTEFNVIDAITGATRPNHDTRSCYWDGTDFNGNLLTDGEYTLWMELTDKNGTGNFSSFSFTKGEELFFAMPSDVPSFSSISITWNPDDPTGIIESGKKEDFKITPNPVTHVFTVSCNGFLEMEVINPAGKTILKSQVPAVDISDQPNGIYFVVVKSIEGVKSLKLIKR